MRASTFGRRGQSLRLVGCLLCWLVAGTAFADGKVVVHEFDGPGGKRARAEVVEILDANGIELLPASQADQAAASAGADLGSAEGRVQVARELRISAFVEGEASKAGARTRLTIRVYRGSDGEQLGDDLKVTAARNALPRAAGDRFWITFGNPIKESSPPPKAEEPPPSEPEETEPEPEPEPEPRAKKSVSYDTEEEDDTYDDSDAPLPSPLDVTLGLRMATRDFSYNDALFGLNGYELDPSPYLAMRLRWYPAAHLSRGFVANIGLDLTGELLMFVSTTNDAGEEFSTKSAALGAALRVRFPLGEHELAALVGYGSRSFSVENDEAIDPNFPDVNHTFVRLGAEGTLVFADPFVLNVHAAYLLGLTHGDLEEPPWFPHATGNGFELEVGVGWRVSRAIELQLAAAMERYGMTLDPQPTDPGVVDYARVAGGATDEYLSLRLSAMWKLW
jgi:hypothetical protein